MTNMQMSKEEAAEYMGATPNPGNAPKYPYGLCLCLNDDSLAKLGFTEPPAVGTKLRVIAMVEVTSTGVNQQQDGDKESRCDMQITDMEVEPAKPAKSVASVLYGE